MSAKDVMSDAAHALAPDPEEVHASNAQKLEKGGPNERDNEPPPPPPQIHNLEKAMKQIQLPIIDPTDVPILRLHDILLYGVKDTRHDFLMALCRPYMDPAVATEPLAHMRYGHRLHFSKPGDTTTMPSILQLITSLSSDISRMELAKDISVQFEPLRSDKHPTEDVDVILKIKPVSRFFLRTSTSVGNSEGTASVQGKLRNVFGGAETLEGSATLGTRTKHSYNFVFSSPVLACPDFWANVSAISQHRDLTAFIRAHEGQHLLRSSLIYAKGDGARHELAYEASHRHFHHILPDASLSIRRLAKPSFKSAISYTFEQDTRDNTFATMVGSYFRSFTEYAGLGGDTSYFKTDTQASVSDTFANGLTWSLAAKTGLLIPLNGCVPCLNDRFMLGGPTCIRMFRLNSLGPKFRHDSLGGDAFWAVGASLLSPIPMRSHWPLKLHAFTNLGQLAQVQPNAARKNHHWTELAQPSVSAGFGVLFQQGPVRLELNFGLPLVARVGDGIRKGLQFGIGIDFL